MAKDKKDVASKDLTDGTKKNSKGRKKIWPKSWNGKDMCASLPTSLTMETLHSFCLIADLNVS